jgi:hypothetical protein
LPRNGQQQQVSSARRWCCRQMHPPSSVCSFQTKAARQVGPLRCCVDELLCMTGSCSSRKLHAWPCVAPRCYCGHSCKDCSAFTPVTRWLTCETGAGARMSRPAASPAQRQRAAPHAPAPRRPGAAIQQAVLVRPCLRSRCHIMHLGNDGHCHDGQVAVQRPTGYPHDCWNACSVSGSIR